MGLGRWTIRMTAKVRADPHSVVAWFEHPDRIEEALAEMAKRGLIDCSVENSFTKSVRIRDIRGKNSSGSAVVHIRAESELGPDGRVGTWSGDRFLVVGHGFNYEQSAVGGKQTKHWDDTMEFLPTSEGATEIIHTHNQRFLDPRWYEWLLPPISERARKNRALREKASRCEATLLLRD